MAKILVELPRVGLVMETARVLRWLKEPGDVIAAGDPLVEVETEKTVVQIEASVDGRLIEILVPAEQEVEVGKPIAWVDDGLPESAQAVPDAAASVDSPRIPASRPPAGKPAAPAPSAKAATDRIVASPAARALAGQRGIDLAGLAGSGPAGRITLADVEAVGAAPAARHNAIPANALPLSPMRRAVARSVALSNATIPQFVVSLEVDWSGVQAACARHYAQRHPDDLRISVNDFLLHATARALLEFPALNATFVGNPESPEAHILPAAGTHIGLIVAIADGMVAPVFHNIERMPLPELAVERAARIARAHAGRLRRDEADGATFSISNLGARGPDWFTGMLNPPESGILSVGRTREVATVRAGEVVVRPMSRLVLTVDHRLVDGKQAAEFLARLVRILESADPDENGSTP